MRIFFTSLMITLMVGVFAIKAHQAFAIGNFSTIDKPIVVELFTSQSCSSCPPADTLLKDLSQNPNVIALSFHVTYWNHLHWKDPLSRELSTNRQKLYSQALRSRRIYTPQMLVNGSDEFVGNNQRRLKTAIQSAAPIKRAQVEDIGGDMVKITLPRTPSGDYTLRLFGVKSTHFQDIKSGENRGRTQTYANAVLRELNLGQWTGRAKSMTIPIPPHADIDRYVILAQSNGGYGPIAAAGQSDL